MAGQTPTPFVGRYERCGESCVQCRPFSLLRSVEALWQGSRGGRAEPFIRPLRGHAYVSGMKSRVHFEDKGTVYEAPIEVVWDFMLHDEEFHPRAHGGGLRNLRWKDVNEITGLASFETHGTGRWIKRSSRITTVPPVARILEELTGRYAGSKIVFLYTPKGERTGVDVFAELASDTLSPEELEDEWRRTLEKSFEEDVPWLRKLVEKRSGKRSHR